jgi:hypothetical protein
MREHTRPSRYAIGLYRASTAEQGNSGIGLEAQHASVRAFVAAQDWTLVAEFSDIASGEDDRRTGFQAALTRCRQLGAVLVAARLDRITRRAHTLSQLLEDGYSIRAGDMPGADDIMIHRRGRTMRPRRSDTPWGARISTRPLARRAAIAVHVSGHRPT